MKSIVKKHLIGLLAFGLPIFSAQAGGGFFDMNDRNITVYALLTGILLLLLGLAATAMILYTALTVMRKRNSN